MELSIPQRAGPKRWRTQYDAIIDLLLAEPTLSNSEIAERMGRTPPWVSTVRNTDMFKARYALRREEVNGAIADGISNKVTDCLDLALDRTKERLQDGNASETFIERTRDNLLAKYGYTNRSKVEMEITLTPADRAWESRREKLKEATVEAEFEPVPEGA